MSHFTPLPSLFFPQVDLNFYSSSTHICLFLHLLSFQLSSLHPQHLQKPPYSCTKSVLSTVLALKGAHNYSWSWRFGLPGQTLWMKKHLSPSEAHRINGGDEGNAVSEQLKAHRTPAQPANARFSPLWIESQITQQLTNYRHPCSFQTFKWKSSFINLAGFSCLYTEKSTCFVLFPVLTIGLSYIDQHHLPMFLMQPCLGVLQQPKDVRHSWGSCQDFTLQSSSGSWISAPAGETQHRLEQSRLRGKRCCKRHVPTHCRVTALSLPWRNSWHSFRKD